MDWWTKVVTALLFLGSCHIARSSSQVYVGSHCTKHSDCVRYCAYSKYGLEGASCCLPEKIRVSRMEWITTGSSTCYCCAFPDNPGNNATILEGVREPSHSSHPSTVAVNPDPEVVEGDAACQAYLEEVGEGPSETKVKGELFCSSKKCTQVMMNVKLTFEFPSVCRGNN